MIDASALKTQGRIVRETTAPFILVGDDGEERTEQITVRFFALSVAEGRTYQEGIVKTGDAATWTDLLLPILESLPDFVDKKQKPLKITRELLDGINQLNLEAIHEAITGALVPKFQQRRSPGG